MAVPWRFLEKNLAVLIFSVYSIIQSFTLAGNWQVFAYNKTNTAYSTVYGVLPRLQVTAEF
jgi:hypothetical protein